MSRLLRNTSALPWILRAAGATCRVRPWPFEPHTAQLVLFNQGPSPTAAQVSAWLGELAAAGYTTVRTGAVRRSTATGLQVEGFATVQTLVLLSHGGLGHLERPRRRARRLPRAAVPAAAAVDLAAFGRPWAVDAAAIDDICRATVHSRARRIDAGGALAAYAVSGRDGTQGFLQRLAVDPAQQRHGLGRALTLDSLRWMARRGVRQALVNTHTENVAAIALYVSVGFVADREPLLVLERAL